MKKKKSMPNGGDFYSKYKNISFFESVRMKIGRRSIYDSGNLIIIPLQCLKIIK